MSIGDATKPQDLGPERLKPAPGTRTLRASVEATGRETDLCSGRAPRIVDRLRILAWLAEGAREVTWALCSLPRERWAVAPPAQLGEWPALRHVQHLAVRESHVTLAVVRHAVDETESQPSTLELDQADAVWDAAEAFDSAESIIRSLGETRFELLQRLEAAPDAAWERPLPEAAAAEASNDSQPIQLDWLLLHARQHELEHLAALWRLVLNWDRVPRITTPGVPLHPDDRLEESH